MGAKLSLEYDQIGDILYITKVAPYPGQETEEIDDAVLARLNPKTGEIEGLEILFFTKRLKNSESLLLPVTADLRLAE